jgi:signal transduction histidine kinase
MEWAIAAVIGLLLIGWGITFHGLLKEKRYSAEQGNRIDLLRKAITAAHAGTFFYNVEDNHTIWDEHTLTMFGLTGETRAIPPGTWESILHPEDLENALNQVLDSLNGTSNLFNHTYRILLPNNQIRWIEGTGFVIRDANNRPKEVTGFHFDVTKQVEYELSLKKSESKARQAMEAKTQFLANMSHEIRTPMNAIVGMIELLTFEHPTKIQQRYLSTLQNSSNVLLRIIDDILDVSKIEAGKLKLESKQFNLHEVIIQCLVVYTQASDHKNLLLTGRIDPRVPAMIDGDSTRLQQVIMNLIGNAFKFTQRGHIILRVVPEGNKALRFSVSDSGVGISENVQSTLFDRFSQADESTTRKFGGTGLGLTIVKEIVELWGGRVSVHSRLGEGSTFTFVLPISEPLVEKEKCRDRVLLASRFHTLASLWREDSTAPQLTWVSDVASFQNAIEQQSFTHLFVEQRFPDAKGQDLIQWAKEKQPDLNTTLIGFEKYVQLDQTQNYINRFQARPYLLNQLWDADFTKQSNSLVKTANHKWPNYHHLKVLCVDDNQSNLIVLSGLLKRFNIKAQCVESGQQAIECIKHETFDLVLMDYEMPQMDGPEATRQILELKQVLIIGLSAHTGEVFQQQAEASGMKGFLRKPIKIPALAEMLGDHFNSER